MKTETEPTSFLPCPFCGHTDIDVVDVVDGSTFRWVKAECQHCGASCGEVRIDTLSPGYADRVRADAIREWNTRCGG